MEKGDILYWMIIILLVIGCSALLASAILNMKRQNSEEASAQRRKKKPKSEKKAPEGEHIRQPKEEPAPKQPPKRKLWRLIIEDPDEWKRYSITFYDEVGIGRAESSDAYEKYLPLTQDGRVSKIHCCIFHRDGRLYLKDEGSRNGTYLNGKAVTEPVMIQKEDTIGVGRTHLEIMNVQREAD